MRVRVFLIGLIPLAWLALAGVAETATGRYSLPDPDYYYLLSSLDMVEHKSLGLFHHPGTPAIMVGAAAIASRHAVDRSTEGIQAAVLRQPERFLSAFHTWSALLIAIALVVLGGVAIRVSESLWLGPLLQLSVFMAPTVAIESVSRFKPEPILLVICVLVIATIVVAVRSTSLRSKWLPLAFGALCGCGLVTKYTFAPVVIVPFLLLRGAGQKALFIAWTLIAAVGFTLPIADHYDDLAAWTYSNLTHVGMYGNGEPGLIEADSYRQGAQALGANNALFDTIVLIALGVIGVAITRRRLHQPEVAVEFRALCALVVSLLFGFALVAKYGTFPDANRYLFSSYCLLGLTLWLSLSLIMKIATGKPFVRIVAVGVILCSVAVSLVRVPGAVRYHIRYLSDMRDAFIKQDAVLREFGRDGLTGHAWIYDIGIRTTLNSLFQASYYSTGQLDALAKLFPTTFFCDSGNCTPENWTTKHLVGLDHQTITPLELRSRFNERLVLIYWEGSRVAARQLSGTASSP